MSRTYISKLRAEQAEATRLKVVEAVASVLGKGLSELTYPAVAEEAGVSLATVQRLYPSKRDLVAGLADHYNRTIQNLLVSVAPPRDIDEFLAELPAVMERTSRIPPGLRAAVASDTYKDHRRERRSDRLAMVDAVLKPFRGRLPARDLAHVRNLVIVLASSAGLTAFNDLAGTNAAEASDAIVWMVRKLLDLPAPPLSQRPSRTRKQ